MFLRFSNAEAGMITDINATNGVTHTVESLVVPASVRDGYLNNIKP